MRFNKKQFLVALAALLVVHGSAQAAFIGTLLRDQPPTVLVASNTPRDTSVTIHYLDTRGRLDVAMILTVGSGQTVAVAMPEMGRAVTRVVIDVDTPEGGQAVVTVGMFTPINVEGSRRLVFNVQ